MASQEGIIQFRGAVGNLQFFKKKDGTFGVRKKTTLDKKKILEDPGFAMTRETMAAFGTVAKAGKLFRDALSQVVSKVADSELTPRMTAALFQILKTDKENERGRKSLMFGDLSSLKGFEFSNAGPVNTTFKGKYSTEIDRANGKLNLVVGEYRPRRDVYRPIQATHFQLHAAALAINFDTGKKETSVTSTEKIEWNNATIPEARLENTITANTTDALFLLFGIEFWMLDPNGKYYELMNRAYNGVVIADVSQV
jgi:hypothetical protein